MGPVTRRSVAAPGAAALMGRGGVGAAREAVAGPREGEGAAGAGGAGLDDVPRVASPVEGPSTWWVRGGAPN